MKLVYKQVAAELIGPFVFGVTAFTSVFFAGSYLLKLTGWLMSGSIGLTMAAWIVLLLLPQILVFTLPMSTLLAVLLGVGRLSSDSEVVALFAGDDLSEHEKRSVEIHLNGCASCRDRLAALRGSRDVIQQYQAVPSDLDTLPSLWPRIRHQ